MWHVELAQPGIEPMPHALEAQNRNHWITRLSPRNKHIKKKKSQHKNCRKEYFIETVSQLTMEQSTI